MAPARVTGSALPLVRGLLSVASVVLLAASNSGCAGYHLGPVKPAAMAQVRTLAVPAFRNNTLEPRLEVLLANVLIKQLQQDGTYRIASEKDADAVVLCTVDKLDRQPARSVRNNASKGILADFYQTSEFTLDLVLKVDVQEKGTGKSLLKREVRGTSSFFVSSANPLTADVNRDERQAISQAAEDASVRLTSYLSEGW
jgi:hypothetical protein